jgi:hypothetical protein
MRELCDRKGARLLMILAIGALVGCENNPPSSALRPPPELPVVALDTPENAARSALLGLQAQLRAIANNDPQAAQEALNQLRSLVAVEAVQRMLNRMPQFKTLFGDDLIEGYINNWGATIAYYAEGFHFDRMRRGFVAASKVAVLVPASGRDDTALIQVTCLRQDDGTWRVSRIEFVTLGTTSAPQPATQPASEP